MNNTAITTDAAEVYKQFQNLTTKQMRSALKRGIAKGSNVVRRKARTNLKQRIGKAATTISRYGDRLLDAVRLTKIKETKGGEFYRFLLITSSRTVKSISFVLRWIEAGTTPRRTRKGWHRGAMQPTHFFSDALTESAAEYNAVVNKELAAQVERINKQNVKK